MPASHTELGFWIVSPRCAPILEPDGHILGSVAALWRSGTGVPSKVSSCSHGKETNATDNRGDRTGTVWIHNSCLGPNTEFSSSCLWHFMWTLTHFNLSKTMLQVMDMLFHCTEDSESTGVHNPGG